jgi:hypothetical protein
MTNTFDSIIRSIKSSELLVTRNSSCVDYIVTNLFAGTVRVMFGNGAGYTFKARKRDILNLLSNDTISLGFWVNNCLNLANPINQYMFKFN